MPKGAEEAPAGAEVRGASEAAAAFLAPSVSVATPCYTMIVFSIEGTEIHSRGLRT